MTIQEYKTASIDMIWHGIELEDIEKMDVEDKFNAFHSHIIQKDIGRMEVVIKEIDVSIGDYGHYSVEGMIEDTVQSLIEIKRKELEELNKK